ncbi:MAG: lytic polysaccharide monooxygenase [Deltaproteobacteria bacterium]|nr:lytic polysaccharide monooxygenase [Deltaproteobacteria bacterium]
MQLRAALLASSLTLLLPASALGHIRIDYPGGSHLTRVPGDNNKEGPCGLAGAPRGENVYTYEAGSTIQVSVKETISHPSYFRIAFDDDGDDAFADPAWIDPPNRECLANDPTDFCKKGEGGDFFNNDSVLMDNLEQHNYQEPIIGGDNGPVYTFDVKLPDVACDNCTLQIIQVMQDPAPIHAPYTPGEEDIYYQCIDLVLTKAATPDAGPPPVGSGGPDDGKGGASNDDAKGGGSSDDDGGCAVAPGRRGGSFGLLLAATLAGLAARRRNRRQ